MNKFALSALAVSMIVALTLSVATPTSAFFPSPERIRQALVEALHSDDPQVREAVEAIQQAGLLEPGVGLAEITTAISDPELRKHVEFLQQAGIIPNMPLPRASRISGAVGVTMCQSNRVPVPAAATGPAAAISRTPIEDWANLRLSADDIQAELAILQGNEAVDYFAPSLLKRARRNAANIEQANANATNANAASGPSVYELFALEYYRFEESGWTDAGYRDLSRWFRGDQPYDHSPEELLALARLVASCLNAFPPEAIARDTTVYRGIAIRPGILDDIYQPGATVTEPTFLSTSLHREVAEHFAEACVGEDSYLLVITSRTGRNVADYVSSRPTDDYLEEAEVLFLPDTTFRVTSRTQEGTRIIVHMEEL